MADKEFEKVTEAKTGLDLTKVGSFWVYTHEKIPGLYIAHRDKETARKSVRSAAEMFIRINNRQIEKGDYPERVEQRLEQIRHCEELISNLDNMVP